MKKSDLRTGMIVTLRNGNQYVVMLNAAFGAYTRQDFLVRQSGYIGLDEYNEDLVHHYKDDRDFDIMEVAQLHYTDDVFDFNNRIKKFLWVRSEPQKITISEIEAILGYKVEIINDK